VYAALLAALQAVPQILTAIEKMSVLYKEINDEIHRQKYEKIKAELAKTTLRIENAETTKERKQLIKDLSDIVSG
jgi:hypothetical protein